MSATDGMEIPQITIHVEDVANDGSHGGQKPFRLPAITCVHPNVERRALLDNRYEDGGTSRPPLIGMKRRGAECRPDGHIEAGREPVP
jgi:hypothetical protein